MPQLCKCLQYNFKKHDILVYSANKEALILPTVPYGCEMWYPAWEEQCFKTRCSQNISTYEDE